MRLSVRVFLTIVIYVAAMAAIYRARPPIMFRSDGRLRPFGVEDHDATVVSFGVAAVATAAAAFFGVAILQAVIRRT